MRSVPMAGSRGPGPARHRARVRGPRPRGSPAVTATYQRGKQAWPRRPVMPALGRGGWPPNRRPYGLVRTPGRPYGTAGWPVDTDGTGFSRGNPPRRRRVVTPAGWAHQPAQSVLRPARSDRPSPIVRLPERGRVRESGPAPRHGAPGGRNPDLVTNDTVPGDRNRMNQRIEPHRRLRGFTITVSQDAGGRRLSHPASPRAAPDRLACLGKLPEVTGPPHHLAPRRALHSKRRSPGSGEPTGISRNGPRIPRLQNAGQPRFVTPAPAGARSPSRHAC
jgi:hypothetical protein